MTNKETADKICNEIDKFEIEFMNEFMERVKQRTPVYAGKEANVHSGALKNGWSVVKNDNGWELDNTQNYAVYVERGTWKMAPRAMVQTTILEIPQIIKIAEDSAKE